MRTSQMISRVLIGAFLLLVLPSAYAAAALTITRMTNGVKTESYKGFKVYAEAANPIILPQDQPFVLKYNIVNKIKKAFVFAVTSTNPAVTYLGNTCKSNRLLTAGSKTGASCFAYVQVTPKTLFQKYPNNGNTLVTLTAFDTSMKSNKGTASLILNKIALTSITLAPNTTTALALGLNKQFTALGTYSAKFSRRASNSGVDFSYAGAPVNISSYVTWASSNPNAATVSASGLVSTKAVGSTQIRAQLNSALYGQSISSAPVALSVGSATVQSISITPQNPSVFIGNTQHFKAQGTFSNGTKSDISQKVRWAFSKSGIASFNGAINQEGSAKAESPGAVTVTATYQGVSGSSLLTVTSTLLSRVVLSASVSSVFSGQSSTITAQGIYSDDNEQIRALRSEDASALTFQITGDTTGVSINDAGVLTTSSNSKGVVTVTALVNGKAKGSANLRIDPVVLKDIYIAPNDAPIVIKGKSLNFRATGTNSDGTTTNTPTLTWRLIPGTGAVTITDPSAANKASINVTGVSPGTVSIEATNGTVRKVVELTVIAVDLDRYTVTCSPSSVAAGLPVACSAQGVNNDGSTAASTEPLNWTSSAGTIGATGSWTTNSSTGGLVTITATGNLSGKTGTATVTVSQPTLSAIRIVPASPNILADGSIIAGKSQAFSIEPTYTLAGYAPPALSGVEWSMTSIPTSGVAELSPEGTLRTMDAGTVTIRARYIIGSNIAHSTTYTVAVKAPVLESLSVNSGASSMAAGQSTTFTATGTYSNGTTRSNLPVSWLSTSGTISSTGLLSINFAAKANPTQVTVTATANDNASIRGSKAISITDPVLTQITVKPNRANLYVGESAQTFTAMGTYEFISGEKPITSGVTWSAYQSTGLDITGTGTASVTASLSGPGKSIKATVGLLSNTASIDVYDANGTLTVPSVVNFTNNMKVRTITIRNKSPNNTRSISISSALPPGITVNNQCSSLSANSSCKITLTMGDGFDKTAKNELIIQTADNAGGNSHEGSKIQLTYSTPWEPIGTVNSTVIDEDSDRVYLGGAFSVIGVKTGGGSLIDGATGEPSGVYSHIYKTDSVGSIIENGKVYATISDGEGGWYIGGLFTINDTNSRTYTNLAHIKSNGELDSRWQPKTNNTVRALALASDGSVFAGGEFTTMNSSSALYLVRINSNGVMVTNSSQMNISNNWIKNGIVRTLVLKGNTLYIGGDFNKLGSEASLANYIASINVSNNTFIPLSAEPNGSVNALASNTTRLFVGGSFTKVGTENHTNIAVYNISNGTASLESTNPGVINGPVYAIAANDINFYIGGKFTSVNNNPRNHIASFSAATGDLTPTNLFLDPGATGNSGVGYSNSATPSFVSALSLSNNTLYVGGDFDRISSGGTTLVRHRMAAIDIDSVATVKSWAPYVDAPANPTPDNAPINAIAVNTNVSNVDSVYIGGGFGIVGKVRWRIAALDLYSGVPIDSWNPSVTGGDMVNTMVLDKTANELYVGGYFTAVGTQMRNHLAAINLDTGTATNWAPQVNGRVRAMALYPDDVSSTLANNTNGTRRKGLFIGGDFTSVDNTLQQHIALLNSEGRKNPQWGSLDTNAPVHALLYHTPKARLFVGGEFTSIGDWVTTYGLAQVEPPTSAQWKINRAFNNTTLRKDDKVYALAIEGDTLHTGGSFVSGNSSNYARINANTGANAGGTFNLNDKVNALALSPPYLYIGGAFTTLNDASAYKYTAIDYFTGATQTPWRNYCRIPAVSEIKSIATSGNIVIVDGMWMNTVQ